MWWLRYGGGDGDGWGGGDCGAAKQWTSTTKDNHTPLAQVLDGSTSNNRVQALSVSTYPSVTSSRSTAEDIDRCMVEWNEDVIVCIQYDIS